VTGGQDPPLKGETANLKHIRGSQEEEQEDKEGKTDCGGEKRDQVKESAEGGGAHGGKKKKNTSSTNLLSKKLQQANESPLSSDQEPSEHPKGPYSHRFADEPKTGNTGHTSESLSLADALLKVFLVEIGEASSPRAKTPSTPSSLVDETMNEFGGGGGGGSTMIDSPEDCQPKMTRSRLGGPLTTDNIHTTTLGCSGDHASSVSSRGGKMDLLLAAFTSEQLRLVQIATGNISQAVNAILWKRRRIRPKNSDEQSQPYHHTSGGDEDILPSPSLKRKKVA